MCESRTNALPSPCSSPFLGASKQSGQITEIRINQKRCQEDACAIMCARHNAQRGDLDNKQAPYLGVSPAIFLYLSRACMRNGPKYGVAGKKYPL